MQPIKSNITSTGKCLNPVTTKCVVWDGPDITCLDGTTLCKGQNVETTLYTLATKLCEIYTALSLEDINTCINGIQDGSSVSIGPTSSIQEVFSAIIKKVCKLDNRVQTLEDTPCLEQTAVVPECLRAKAVVYPSYNPVTFTLPLQYYAELVANSVCGLLIDITALQNNALIINQQIDDLWAALAGCTSSSQNFVLPTCTYNWTVSPNGNPVTIQTAYSWLEADYCTLRGLLGTNSQITTAINSQCAQLGSEDTLAPGVGGTLSSLSGWSDTPLTIADAMTNMWLTVCDMRSYISDVLSLCCKSPCDYLQVGFVPIWSADGTKVTISFIDPSNPVQYESAAVVPPSPNPQPATGALLPPWVLAQFPTASQTTVTLVLDDGNGYGFTKNTAVTLNGWAQTPSQYQIDFSGAGVPVNYDQTSVNQTITMIFDYDVVVNGVTKNCTFNFTQGLAYECSAPKPYNCNKEIKVTSTTGTDLKVVVKDLVKDTPSVHIAFATSAGSGTDTLRDNSFSFAGLIGYVVTITQGAGIGQCRYIKAIVAGSSNHEIQLDSAWDIPIDNTSEYEVKGIHYPSTSWVSAGLGVTGFNIVVSVYDPATFDVNDQNTWQQQVAGNNISPSTISTTGWLVANGVLPGNTQYAVIINALYPCGESDPVYVVNFNQIAASVSIQQGTSTTPVFSVLDGQVTVSGVLSNNTSLPNGFANNTTQALYALALPQGTNVTKLEVTPAQANWLLPLSGNGKNFCICGIYTDPEGVSGTTPNHDVTVGKYRGYDVSVFQLDSLNNPITITDSNNNAYKTDSLTDPTISFPLNVPGPPIVVNVPATYPDNNLPVIVQYDPTPYQVNTSPIFHTITLDLTSYTDFVNNDIFPKFCQTQIWIQVKRWDSTTNNYVDYTPQKLIHYSMPTFTLGPGASAGPYVIGTPGGTAPWVGTNSDPTSPAINQLLCGYGDALFVYVSDYAPFPDPSDDHDSSIWISAASGSLFSCTGLSNKNPSNGLLAAMGWITTPFNTNYNLRSKVIITEDYVVRTRTFSRRN